MTRFITQAVYNGTKQNYAISGKNVDSVYQKAVRNRTIRQATVLLFFNRKTGKMVDIRLN